MFAQLLQVLLQLVVGMGAANHHQRRSRVAHLNLFTHAALFFPGFSFRSAVHHFHDGRVDHAQNRFTFINQRNIDGKLAVTFDELFGAV